MRAWCNTIIAILTCCVVSLAGAKMRGKDNAEDYMQATTFMIACIALLTANKAYYREPRE